MFNLYQLITGAQSGRGLDNLAQQFGLTREETDKAVKALMPALSTAFMAKAAQPGGLGDIAGAMTDNQHKEAYADPNAAGNSQTRQKGNDVAGSIFGSDVILGQVIGQAARFTGLSEETLRGMMPVLVSMILGGAATTLHNGGMGEMLGELAHGGLGGILTQFGVGATGQGAPGNIGGTGGFAEMVGNIMSNVFGAAHPADPKPSPEHTGSGASPGDGGVGGAGDRTAGVDPAAGLPPIVQAGLDMFGKMFEAGVPSSAAQPAGLGEKITESHAAGR